MPVEDISFSQRLLDWFDIHGRKNLPWQQRNDPYKTWVSEIMLQQTQVQTVIPYFNQFIQNFPSIQKLALAKEDKVLSLWSGLGYYSRARNLHQTAKIIWNEYQGVFPDTLDILTSLPGIGATTAAAIASLAFDKPTAILDANVKRVIARYFQVEGYVQQKLVHKKLFDLAQSCMPATRCAEYTQAIMDLGALCCTSKAPDCSHCPLNATCLAYKNKVVLDYPSKKPQKQRPTLDQFFLLLHNSKNEIYLEKKFPTGLWGGLWCLPIIDTKICPIIYIKERYGLLGQNISSFISFKHSFSHFHLNIHAKAIEVEYCVNAIKENSGIWFEPSQFNDLGLAKPISLILKKWYI